MILKNEPKSSKAPGCCGRLCTELSCGYPFFSLDEQDGTVLDIKSTFAPGKTSDLKWLGWTFLIVRLSMIGWISGAGVAVAIIDAGPDAIYWPMCFTNLTALLTLACFLFACALQLLALLGEANMILSQPSSSKGPDSKFVTFVWFLYSTSVPFNLIVVINYWLLVYGKTSTLTVDTITLHGISCALLMIDGVLIAGIPIRAKHVVFSFTWGCLLVLWSIIHSLSDIGDGGLGAEDEHHFNEDDQLYIVLDWKHDPTSAFITAFLSLFVLLPFCFVISYIFALLNRHTVSEPKVVVKL